MRLRFYIHYMLHKKEATGDLPKPCGNLSLQFSVKKTKPVTYAGLLIGFQKISDRFRCGGNYAIIPCPWLLGYFLKCVQVRTAPLKSAGTKDPIYY